MSDRVLVGTRKGLFTIDRTGARGSGWAIARTAFVGDNVSMVLADHRDRAIWAALDHGHFGVKVHKSVDEGESWTECPAPAFPPRPEGEEDREPAGGRPIPWTVLRIWALEAGHPSQAGVLWCGTIPGGLFCSTDGGASWSLVRSLWDHPKRKEWFGGGAEFPGIHSICVDPTDGQRVSVGVSCGGVWVTSDGGESWNCQAAGMRAAYMPPERQYDPYIQDPHRVVRCRSRPNALWAAHHNGIFRTTDNAASWQEVKAEPSSFGFATAVHPNNPELAWFVPAENDERRVPVHGRVVVVRTNDGGRSFTVLRKGLPQEHAYDITYRHALDIDASGDLGTTTGSFWLSEDQGDSWQTVSEHLPPVYCVRFVEGEK